MKIVVVGAGAIGLLTAAECVRAGAQVELVEQAAIPSPSATSSDSQRVVRSYHRGDATLTIAAADLTRGWRELERRFGRQFFHRTGVLTVAPRADVDAALVLLAGVGARVAALSGRELRARFPHVRFGCAQTAVLEPDAGVVRADDALVAAACWLRAHPMARTHPHRRAARVLDSGTVVLADGEMLVGDGVIVAAGPWSRDLVPARLAGKLTLKRQTMLSYAPRTFAAAWSRSPAILGLGEGTFGAPDAWLIPPVAGAPARLSAASACRTVPEMTGRRGDVRWRDHLKRRFNAVLTDFVPAEVRAATDGYYLTDEASRGPMLAQLGMGPVWAYAACGGMSFKFAPVLASVLADRALGRQPRLTGLESVDLPRFVSDYELERVA